MRLEELNHELGYRPGAEQPVADCLSRNPLPQEIELDKDGEPLSAGYVLIEEEPTRYSFTYITVPNDSDDVDDDAPENIPDAPRIPKMMKKPPRTPKIQMKTPSPSPKSNKPRPRVHHASTSAVLSKTLRIPNDVDEL